jgi:hypothetical protein
MYRNPPLIYQPTGLQAIYRMKLDKADVLVGT